MDSGGVTTLTERSGAWRALDIVLVPDFLGPASHIQEAQSLFFLASWLENAGKARQFPVHLACIGEPPVSVRRLAETAGVRISLHEPMGLRRDHHVGNKLRGLEVDIESNRLLLLDIDTLVLSDISWLARTDDCLAVAPDDCPRVTLGQWETIYRELGQPMPTDRPLCLSAELGLPRFPGRNLGYKVPAAERMAGLPYHNAGVLLAPRDCGLRSLWEENIRRIAAMFPTHPKEISGIHRSDQAGLAVSLEMLRQQGWTMRRLPDTLHTRWRHFYTRQPLLDQVGILHLTTFLHSLARGVVTEDQLQQAARDYLRRKLRNRLARVFLADAARMHVADAAVRHRRCREHCRQVEQRVLQLLQRWIRPVLADRASHYASAGDGREAA